MRRPDADTRVAARIEQSAQRAAPSSAGSRWWPPSKPCPNVAAVSPTVSGPAVALRGNATRAVVLYGVDPARFAAIYPVRARMVSGSFAPTGTRCVIGRELADDLGVRVGDKVRLTAAMGATKQCNGRRV